MKITTRKLSIRVALLNSQTRGLALVCLNKHVSK